MNDISLVKCSNGKEYLTKIQLKLSFCMMNGTNDIEEGFLFCDAASKVLEDDEEFVFGSVVAATETVGEVIMVDEAQVGEVESELTELGGN